MDAFPCPKGHSSIESDYCSECGAKIPAATAQPPSSPAPPGGSPDSSGAIACDRCPACGASRETDDLAFCEICGWSFANGPAAGQAIAPADPADGAGADSSVRAMLPAMSVPVSGPPAHHWEVTISIDPSLRQPASPEPPAGIAPVTVALEAPVNLIGRKSEAQAIFPEISLPYDEAVSHRHALLQLNDRGTLLLRDIGASNGTQLNGKEIVAMQDYPIQDGDQILLGHWSRISVKAISDKAIQ